MAIPIARNAIAKDKMPIVFGGADNTKDTPKSVQKNVSNTSTVCFNFLLLITIPDILRKPKIINTALIAR